MTDLSAQTLFWRPITEDYWISLSVLSSFGTVFLFKYMLRTAKARKERGEPTIDGMTIARLGMLGGLILTAFAPLNSACQAWAVGSFAFGGSWFALMLELGWARRNGSVREKLSEICREIGRKVFAARDRVSR